MSHRLLATGYNPAHPKWRWTNSLPNRPRGENCFRSLTPKAPRFTLLPIMLEEKPDYWYIRYATLGESGANSKSSLFYGFSFPAFP